MKILIIAGPYESARIVRAAKASGLQAFALEAGDSLSGRLREIDPDAIVVAPRVIHPEPQAAIARIQAVPQGRVPLFLIGDASEEDALTPLGEAFFERPVSPSFLFRVVREGLGLSTSPDEADAGASLADVPTAGFTEPLPAAAIPPSPSRKRRTGGLAMPGRPSLEMFSARIDADFDDAFVEALAEAASFRPAASRGVAVAAPPIEAPGLDDPRLLRLAALEAETGDSGPYDRGSNAVGIDNDGDDEVGGADEADGDARTEFDEDGSHQTVEAPEALVEAIVEKERSGRVTRAIPVPAQVARPYGEARAEAGDLAREDTVTLFYRLFRQKLTGRVVLERRGVTKTVGFDGGVPVSATSSLKEDRMGDLLVREGKISASQAARATEMVVESGRKLGAVLVDMSLLKRSELFPAVRRHFEELIHSVIGWDEGRFSVEPGPAPEDKIRLARHPVSLLIEGARRRLTLPILHRRVGWPGARPRLSRVEADVVLADAGLTPAEMRVVPLLTGEWRLDELPARAGATEEEVCRVTFALAALDLLPRGALVARPAPAPERQAPHDERARESVIDRDRVLARHALVRDGDYFQIMGVRRDANAHEIRRAWESLRREFAPESLDPEVSVELGGEIAAIQEVLDEGMRVLGDEDRRQRYRAQLERAAHGGAA